MNNIEAVLKRLLNYERVLLDVIRTSKRELICMAALNTFLRHCLNRDFSKISFDEFLRSSVSIDSRRFSRIISGQTLLTDEELHNIYAFNRLESQE